MRDREKWKIALFGEIGKVCFPLFLGKKFKATS